MSAPETPPPADPFNLASLPPHPRLFAKPDDWERARRLTQPGPEQDKLLAAVFAEVRQEADGLLTAPPLVRELEGVRLLHVSREAIRRISYLAAVYRLTSERKYADRAILELDHVTKFEDWNDVLHFLDVAEMALAVAIGYDWLHAELDAPMRAQLEEALATHALRISLEKDAQGNERWWINGDNNWNQVCHGGLVAAALAIGDQDAYAELACAILDRAVKGLPHAAAAYAPDGAYAEGPMYWAYGTSYHIVLADALLSATGSTHGTVDYPGFMESATYMRTVTAPSGDFYNYADCGLEGAFNLALFWMALQSGQAATLRPELDKLRDGKLSRYIETNRFSPLLFFWYRPELAAKALQSGEAPPLAWRGRGPNPVVMIRTAYDDPNALFLGIKGGSPGDNHAHMDGGSFVLEADGVRWALDLGKQDYHTLESAGIKIWDRHQDSERWSVFCLNAESHNIPRFGGAPQLVSGEGELVAFVDRGADSSAVFDLTSLHADHVKHLRRGVRMLGGQAVLVQDEWDSGAAPADYAWQLLTDAKVKQLDLGWELERDGKSLRILLLGAPQVELETTVADTLLRDFDQKNPGATRLQARLKDQPAGRGSFRVLLVPGSSGQVEEPPIVPLDEWVGE